MRKAIPVLALLALLATSAGAEPTSRIRVEADGRRWLEVDGAPFLVLAVQPDAWAMEHPDAAAERQIGYARALGANTVHVPIRWAAIEPERGRYDLSYVDWLLEQAWRAELRLILTWFGSNTVGKTDSPTGLRIVPGYVSADPATYARVHDGEAEPRNVLDPADPQTLERERAAFAAVLRHVAAHPRGERVILWQILNEVGVAEGEPLRHDASAFREHLVRYAGELVRTQKRIHPVPSYMNFWEALIGASPFAFLDGIPELDFVGPDLYGKPGRWHWSEDDYRQFRVLFNAELRRYRRGRNVSFVPETDTDAYYRSYLSLFYVLGSVPGIGMDLWSISRGSQRGHDPLVDRRGRLEAGGERIAEVYRAVGAAMTPIVRAQGSPRLAVHVAEEAGEKTLRAGRYVLEVDAREEGALLAIEDVDGALVLVGRRLRVTLPADLEAATVETGRFEHARWVPSGTVPSTPPGDAGASAATRSLSLGPAAVIRVTPRAGPPG